MLSCFRESEFSSTFCWGGNRGMGRGPAYSHLTSGEWIWEPSGHPGEALTPPCQASSLSPSPLEGHTLRAVSWSPSPRRTGSSCNVTQPFPNWPKHGNELKGAAPLKLTHRTEAVCSEPGRSQEQWTLRHRPNPAPRLFVSLRSPHAQSRAGHKAGA